MVLFVINNTKKNDFMHADNPKNDVHLYQERTSVVSKTHTYLP